jgi:hypothetical protein
MEMNPVTGSILIVAAIFPAFRVITPLFSGFEIPDPL